ncbi:hypothetical protein BC832DRAFT_591544 [Gaertneriomyces semiglobifer]|nr:hypothetical protein BC832DRAFT_591544 [Gaertneriomyces semiglobifer]
MQTHIDFNTAVVLNYVFTGIAFAVQLGNSGVAVKHAIQRRTLFNGFMATCMVVYAASFIPLFFTSKLAVETAYLDKETHKDKFDQQSRCVRLWTAAYAVATLIYIILIQIRFRVVKSVLRYRNFLDNAYIIVSTIIWIGTIVILGIIYPPTPSIQSIATIMWTIYALLVDNVLSIVFITQLYAIRSRLKQSRDMERSFKRVRAGLFFLCGMTWIGVSFSVIGNAAFAKDQVMRTLFFRVSLIFSPLEFLGALIYIYTVRMLFNNPSQVGNSGTFQSGNDANDSRTNVVKGKKPAPALVKKEVANSAPMSVTSLLSPIAMSPSTYNPEGQHFPAVANERHQTLQQTIE